MRDAGLNALSGRFLAARALPSSHPGAPRARWSKESGDARRTSTGWPLEPRLEDEDIETPRELSDSDSEDTVAGEELRADAVGTAVSTRTLSEYALQTVEVRGLNDDERSISFDSSGMPEL